MRIYNTNVTLKEAIEIAQQKLYNQESPPEIQKFTKKKLMNMALSMVYFKCIESWHVQTDGLPIGASLAAIFANLRLKRFDFALKHELPTRALAQDEKNCLFPCCSKKVTYRSKNVDCERL